jgi:23S rRNA pseudouridine1911/1915/1917 synthase
MYGGSLDDIDRQALHCGRLCFITPDGGREVTVTSPLPKAMSRLLEI